MNWRYVALPVHPDAVPQAVRGLAALGFRGANVTVPHKQVVIPVLDATEQTAELLNAVNTIVIERDNHSRMLGYNTDGPGFLRALREGGFDLAVGGKAVVIGAGGAARAVIYGLLSMGMDDILVVNRTQSNGQALVNQFKGRVQPDRLKAVELSAETLVEAARRADLLVNTTTVGMTPNTCDSVWPDEAPMPPDLTVFDLVYNPLETHLLKQARKSGARAIDGLGMLVWQGALAFEMWTGRPAPAEVMRKACMEYWRRITC